MKYQKSMLKIYELLLTREFIIEDIIKKASVGRTSSFEAIKWMDENGFIKIINIGKQKQISLNKDRYTLQFKSFIDSLKFKELNPNLKYSINLFIDHLKNEEIKCILLFGSALYEKNPRDIDILIVYSDEINKNDVINDRLLNSACLFGFDNYINLLTKEDKVNIQFSEAVNWYISSYNNVKNKDLFNNCLDNLITNLGFVYSSINNISSNTKNEAKKALFSHYGKLNKLENSDNYKKIEIIKEVLTEIGKEIYK